MTGINERYWAALYARENRVLYDPDEKTFYRYCERTGLWETVTPESIRETISCRILEVSREAQQFTLEIQITQARAQGGGCRRSWALSSGAARSRPSNGSFMSPTA